MLLIYENAWGKWEGMIQFTCLFSRQWQRGQFYPKVKMQHSTIIQLSQRSHRARDPIRLCVDGKKCHVPWLTCATQWTMRCNYDIEEMFILKKVNL